jgi:hypothetical protein
MNALAEPGQAFHHGTSPVFSLLTDDQLRSIADIEADASMVERLEYLAERANEGELSPAERTEYEGYIEANNLIAILQAEARYRLRAMGS